MQMQAAAKRLVGDCAAWLQEGKKPSYTCWLHAAEHVASIDAVGNQLNAA
jgi:hypothetical protein